MDGSQSTGTRSMLQRVPVKSRGWLVVKRTVRMPLTPRQIPRSSASFAPPVHVAVHNSAQSWISVYPRSAMRRASSRTELEVGCGSFAAGVRHHAVKHRTYPPFNNGM